MSVRVVLVGVALVYVVNVSKLILMMFVVVALMHVLLLHGSLPRK